MKSINSISDINVSRILRLLWQKKGISRVAIASQLGIDKSTVTKIASSLQDIGIITAVAEGDAGPQGGRKPIFLEITRTFACVGGIEINPERFVCCLLDMHGTVLFQHQEVVMPDAYERENCTGIFYRAFEMIVAEAEKLGIPLVGIGAGLPAMVNSDKGIIYQSVPLMIDKPFAFADEIGKQVGMPVLLENDARCCCYGEQMLTMEHDIHNMLFLLTEYRVLQPKKASKKNLSVGMGLIINDKIYRGTEFSAGEFRSMLWNEGNNGQFLSGEDRLETMAYDNTAIQSVFVELAQHVAFLVNTLNLEAVYIGGIDQHYAKKIAEQITQRIEFQWPYQIPRNYDVRLASLGSLSVAFGAACMYLEQMFALPSLSSPSRSGPSILEWLSTLKNLDSTGSVNTNPFHM